MAVETLRWVDGELYIIDQTRLPAEFLEIRLGDVAAVWHAIKILQVRGAPAIGVAAAFGILVAVNEKKPATAPDVHKIVAEAAAYLSTSRPTAVNLFWALDRMKDVLEQHRDVSDAAVLINLLEEEAVRILDEDNLRCRAIGEHGSCLINDGDGVLTHCNAGGLATAQHGTALSVMFRAHEEGKHFRVFADETRPLLQGARLTAWELMQAGIDVTLICDHAAPQVMREGKIQCVIVGADRIAANGDAANKIGTYNAALAARAHGVPFYVAAPFSTFDMSLQSGDEIPIEQRDANEITAVLGTQTAPENVNVYNPAFDVTPADFIAGIVTEKGILRPPYRENIVKCLQADK